MKGLPWVAVILCFVLFFLLGRDGIMEWWMTNDNACDSNQHYVVHAPDPNKPCYPDGQWPVKKR
jgi:hypothetical protein